MKILLASSEAVPFGKTGGLADVASALPKALEQLGHDVSLFVPHYPKLVPDEITPVHLFDLTVRLGMKVVYGSVLQAKLPGSDVDVFLIDQLQFFNRDGLYQDASGEPFLDNAARFMFFSRAVLQAAERLNLRPDIVHANDWQTGLMPALLEMEYKRRPAFANTRSVMTVHNLAFQGTFWHWDMQLTGLDWDLYNWRQMEAWGQLNLLKTGIVFADKTTTVSPTYAEEIQTAELGFGLDSLLQHRQSDLTGILNGIDAVVWNPATDPHLATNYDASTVSTGKLACKIDLQRELGLPRSNDRPLFGMISRMTDQKGFDLIQLASERMMATGAQFAFLGTGEAHFEGFVRELAERHPEQVASVVGYDDGLAHRIEAGSDVYLMPSRFEPCGLNQMYSMQYGTVPLVCRVGGLADTVVDASLDHLATGVANGFSFERATQSGEYTLNPQDADELSRQVARAVELFADSNTWNVLRKNGMQQDWSWNASAAKYAALYESILEKRMSEAA